MKVIKEFIDSQICYQENKIELNYIYKKRLPRVNRAQYEGYKVYFLIDKYFRIVYIEMTRDFINRMYYHKTDKKFELIYYIKLNSNTICSAIESAAIKYFKPPLNVNGKNALEKIK